MRAGNGKRRKSVGAGGDYDAVGGDTVIGDDTAAGKGVGFSGVNGRVGGIVVSEYRYNGIEYVMVRDTGGGYHGYAKEGITQ